MANFIVAHRFSKVMPVMKETVQKILNEGKPTLIFFEKTKGRLADTFKMMAKDYPSLNSMYKNLEDKDNQHATAQLMSIIGIHPREAPVLVLLPFKPPKDGIIPKYKTDKLSQKNIKKFIDSGLQGKLEIYLKSEDEDLSPNQKYHHVTLDNFDSKVYGKSKFFLLGMDFFQEHMPQEIKKVFRSIGEMLEGLGLKETMDLGVCDVYKNEISGKLSVVRMPQIMIVEQGGDKSKEVIYDGPIETEKIVEWIKGISGLALDEYKVGADEMAARIEASLSGMTQSEKDL